MIESERNQLIEAGLISNPASARGRLLQAAARLFRRNGYLRTTVRDLGAELGIQSGSLFHHFKTKDDILRAVMEESIRFHICRLRAALAKSDNAEARVLTLIRCDLESIYNDNGYAMAVVVKEWDALSQTGQAVILRLRDDYEQIWLDELDRARAEGAPLVDMDSFMLRRLLAGALCWTLNWYNPQGSVSVEELSRNILKLALK